VTVVAKDQDGAVIEDAGPVEFSSSDEAVATVTPDGTITGVGGGSAQITASLTADEVTLSDATSVTVEDVPETADVTAPAFDFEPPVVDVRAGGTVTWTFSNLAHTVTFVTAGAPENIPVLQGGSESRTFPSSGVFDYQCDLHAEMTGTVRVH
jgi:plastocyanin